GGRPGPGHRGAGAHALRLARRRRVARRQAARALAATGPRLPGIRLARRDGRDRHDDGADEHHGGDPMNQRRHVTLVAAAATLLATAPMATIFQSWTWLIDCLLAIVAVCGSALLARSLRAPVWAQGLAMVAGLTMIMTLLFGKHAFAGLIPTTGTLRHFAD